MLVLQICRCKLVYTRGHIACSCYLAMICQPSHLPYVRWLHQFPCSFSEFMYLYYLALPSYYWAVASSKVFAYCAEAYMVHPDKIWQYVTFFHNYNTLVLASWLMFYKLFYLSSCWEFLEGSEGLWYLESILYIFFQLQCNCHYFIQGCISYHLCLCLNNSL